MDKKITKKESKDTTKTTVKKATPKEEKVEAKKTSFLDKIKSTSSKVGAFMKKTINEVKEESKKAKTKETVKPKLTSKEEMMEKMKIKIDDPKKMKIKDALHMINAIDGNEIYIAGITTLKEESSMLKMLKKDKDKVALSCVGNTFYVSSYHAVDGYFKTYKIFTKADVGSIKITTEILEKKIVIRDKENYFLISIDVTDNGSNLEAFEKLLK